jgi:hypothetical protein
MATKAELTAEILEIDPSAETDGLKHAELEVLLMDVKEKAAGGSDDSADQAPKAEVKSSPASGKVIGNAREQGACRVAGIELAAKGQDGDSVELTLEQMQDQNLLAKISRNIGSGLLEWR